MSVISIRVPDDLLKKTKARYKALQISQTAYIRKAIEHMNDEVLAEQRKKQLIKASLLVRKESMRVNAEFDEIEHDPED